MGLSAIILKIALTTGLNCTWLRLVQLLAYRRAIFYEITLKPMWLSIHIAWQKMLLQLRFRRSGTFKCSHTEDAAMRRYLGVSVL